MTRTNAINIKGLFMIYVTNLLLEPFNIMLNRAKLKTLQHYIMLALLPAD